MQKLLLFITAIILIPMQVFALELDVSVDEEIRKNYKPSASELKQLPKLPNLDKSVVSGTVQPATTNTKIEPFVPKESLKPVQKGGTKKVVTGANPYVKNTKIDDSLAIKLKKGTKFKVKSVNAVSDATRVGAKISFRTQEPITQRYITIPAGTLIKGVITDSHLPQITGNGGLIEIKIDSIYYNGNTKTLNGKITKAAQKKIFLNNIKGERKYLENIPKYAKKGKPFYRKMMNTTSKLSQNPIGWILTPFTVISGVAVYGTTIVTSPISAAFSKGGRITIPAGSYFELKLKDTAYME